MRLTNVAPFAFLGTLAIATMDVKIIADSCAGPYFEQAMQAPGNPCPPGNYECVCGPGFSFMEQFLLKALTTNPGACPGGQLLELQSKAKDACGGGAPAPGGTTPPSTPITTSPVTPITTPNVTLPTGVLPPGGNVTPPAGTPTSPSVFTGAAATAAIGQFVGAAGVAAAAVAFGL